MAENGGEAVDPDLLIAFTDVSLRRDGHTLVGPVTWSVELDERWVIIGANGAGKTSLLRIAAALPSISNHGPADWEGWNRVGMAVPDWPTTFGVNMFLYNFFEAPLGVVIEHRHRLFGSALGLASIVLAIWFIAADPRRWTRRISSRIRLKSA